MLEVGRVDAPFEWNRAHFAAWCIVSSPLVLGLELTDEKLEPIHTNLTTASAVEMHRQVHRSYITCYVKSVPCGPVVQIIAERSQDVAFLHHLFRAGIVGGDVEHNWIG